MDIIEFLFVVGVFAIGYFIGKYHGVKSAITAAEEKEQEVVTEVKQVITNDSNQVKQVVTNDVNQVNQVASEVTQDASKVEQVVTNDVNQVNQTINEVKNDINKL